MKALERMVWVDIETTGLDPRKNVMLEIAVVITKGDLEFTEISALTWNIARAVREEKAACGDLVRQMHTDNGLWDACEASITLLCDVEAAVARFIQRHDAAGGPICGSSPHFDKAFIDVEMPLVAACFNHRTFDVSTLKQACAQRYVKVPEIGTNHRALSDIRASIEIARQLPVEWRT